MSLCLADRLDSYPVEYRWCGILDHINAGYRIPTVLLEALYPRLGKLTPELCDRIEAKAEATPSRLATLRRIVAVKHSKEDFVAAFGGDNKCIFDNVPL